MQILEDEINLREETRVAQQARAAIEEDEFEKQAGVLTDTQAELVTRTREVIDRILELPDAKANFGKELRLLDQVATVMADARQILARPDTGPDAIAAETEAIELLLQSKRINPSGGGGGGSSPGGGGKGTTSDSALALLGKSNQAAAKREETGDTQTTGTAGRELPPEWRAGIDEFFHRWESAQQGQL